MTDENDRSKMVDRLLSDSADERAARQRSGDALIYQLAASGRLKIRANTPQERSRAATAVIAAADRHAERSGEPKLATR